MSDKSKKSNNNKKSESNLFVKEDYTLEFKESSFRQKFVSSLILHTVANTIAYNNGTDERKIQKLKIDYNFSNQMVFSFLSLGGINTVDIKNKHSSYHIEFQLIKFASFIKEFLKNKKSKKSNETLLKNGLLEATIKRIKKYFVKMYAIPKEFPKFIDFTAYQEILKMSEDNNSIEKKKLIKKSKNKERDSPSLLSPKQEKKKSSSRSKKLKFIDMLSTKFKSQHIFIDPKYKIPIDPKYEIDPLYKGAGNSGSASSCFWGLVFNNQTFPDKYIDNLIKFSIETSRLTNKHPVGYLGAVSSAYLIALCFEKTKISAKSIYLFPFKLIKLLESGKIEKHLKEFGGLDEYKIHKDFFIDKWKKYVQTKFGISFEDYYDSKTDSTKKDIVKISFVENSPFYNPAYRSRFYTEEYGFPSKTRVYPGMGGHDSVIIAYDCLLDSIIPKISWEKVIIYSALHMGDNDATAAICGAMFGAIFGIQFIPEPTLNNISLEKIYVKVADSFDSIINIKSSSK